MKYGNQLPFSDKMPGIVSVVSEGCLALAAQDSDSCFDRRGNAVASAFLVGTAPLNVRRVCPSARSGSPGKLTRGDFP